MLKTSFNCDSPELTHQLGVLIGQRAKPGEIWDLEGPLGAGKTQFVKGLAQGLGYGAAVTSPTFSLQNIYEGRLPLYHFDWYRLERQKEVEDLGWFDWIGRGGVTVVEWGDKFPGLFPPTLLKISFDILSDLERRLSVEASHPESIPQVEELIRCWPP